MLKHQIEVDYIPDILKHYYKHEKYCMFCNGLVEGFEIPVLKVEQGPFHCGICEEIVDKGFMRHHLYKNNKPFVSKTCIGFCKECIKRTSGHIENHYPEVSDVLSEIYSNKLCEFEIMRS